MKRVVLALFLGLGLGLLFLIVFFVIGSIAYGLWGDSARTLIVTLILMTAYFFICQFSASRGKPDALREDWPVMVSLAVGPIVISLMTALGEKREVFLTQGLGSLLAWVTGTLAGALTASGSARRRSRQQ